MTYPDPQGQPQGEPSAQAPQPDYQPPVPPQSTYPPTDPQGWAAQPATTAQQPVFDPGQTPVYDPNSGQPMYTPTAPQPAYTPAPPGGGSKAPLWIALAVVLVLLLGGAATAVVLLSGNDNKKASATNTPGVTSTTGSITVPSRGPVSNVQLDTPQTVAGYDLANDPSMNALLELVKGQIGAAGTSASDSAYAIYQDPNDPSKMVMVVALAQPITNPSAELSGMFTGLAAGLGANPTTVKDVSPGPLGGEAKCATANAAGQAVGICAWTDEGSLGMLVFFGSGSSDNEAQFLEFRAAIETKS